MNTKFLCIVMGLIGSVTYGQVGINTEDPKASLDVNGNVRIRTTPVLPSAQDLKVMVLDDENVVNTTDLSNIFERAPTANTIIKGTGGTGFSVLSLSLLNGWQKVSFPTLEIDEGLDFNTSTQEFTALEKGIYHIYFNIEMASLLSASTLGAGIFKIKSGTNTAVLISEESFLNVSVLSINVSPPVRKTQTIVKLDAGDKIVFGIKIPLTDISLFNNSKAAFTIWRMK